MQITLTMTLTVVELFLSASYCSQIVHVCPFSLCCSSNTDNVEAELLHTFTKVYKFDTMLLLVRLAVLTAVTLTVPIVLFPVSTASSPQFSLGSRTFSSL